MMDDGRLCMEEEKLITISVDSLIEFTEILSLPTAVPERQVLFHVFQ